MIQSTCSFRECNRPIRTAGLCNSHYGQWYRGKDLTPIKARKPDPESWECQRADCMRPRMVRGYCMGHYRQLLEGEEMRDLQKTRRLHEVVGRDESGRKRCVTCAQWREEVEFNKHQRSSDGLTHTCKHCFQSRRKSDYQAKGRPRFLEKTYGITMAQYEAIFEAQGGLCATCGSSESGGKGWHVDHDHSCCKGRGHSCGMCVRGILCTRCNMALGFALDNPETLKNMIEYINRPPAHKVLAT